MNCAEINKYLFGFLDNTLPEKELTDFKKHMETCLPCIERVITEKDFEKSLKEKLVAFVTVPAALKDKIIQKISAIPILKITFQDGKEEIVQVTEDLITFGRNSKNTIALSSDHEISRKHCRIDRKEGKYEIVDLNSRNGVYVNEQKVTRHFLMQGDKIRIGHTIILFGLSTTTTVIKPEHGSGSATTITEIISPTPSLKKRKQHFLHVQNKRASRLPYFITAAGFLIVMGTIAYILHQNNSDNGIPPSQKQSSSQISEEQIIRLQKDLNKIYLDINSLAQGYLYKEAINKGKDFLAYHSKELNDPQKHYLEVKIEFLEQCLIKEENAKDSFAQLEKDIKEVDDPDLLKDKYEELYLSSINTSVASRIKEKLAIINESVDRKKELEKIFASVKLEVEAELASGNYGRAINNFSSFGDQSDSPYFQSLVAKEIDTINKQAKADLDLVAQKTHEMVDKKEFEKAKDFCLAQQSRFNKTLYSVQLNSELSLIDKLTVQEEERVGLIRKSSLKMLYESEDLSKKYDYTNAVLKISDAIKTIKSNYPELNQQLSIRLTDLEKEASLFGNLLERIKRQVISVPRINLAGAVLTTTNEYFYVSGRTIKWSSLTPVELYKFYKIIGVTSSEAEKVAIFCLEHKLMDDVFDAFNTIVNKNPARKSELENLLSRYTDKQIPPGGFVVYKNKWLTPEEKSALVAQENTIELAAKIKSANKLPELEKICFEFSQIIQANPAQQTELQGIINPTLKEKYNSLKKIVDQKFASVNLDQLAVLKKELNKKREAALKELREGKPVGEGAHPKISSEMDKKVNEVRVLWERPLERIVQLDKSLNEVVESMKFLAVALKKYNTSTEDKTYDLDVLSFLTTGSKIDIKNYPINSAETRLIKENKKIIEENEGDKVVSEAEKEMVKLQNEYRIMMGLRALRINDQLSKAGRKHSEFMRSCGLFAHCGIGDGDPASRGRAEGYSGCIGENIAAGQSDPYGAFTGWYWSHGHHINMIGAWTTIGGGIAEKHYTTMFGR